jgi:NADPH:quinone reductase
MVRAGVNPTDWKTRAGVSSKDMPFDELTPGQGGAGFVDSLGAQHVVNYRTTDAAAAIRAIAPDGVDLIAEVSPARNNDLDVAVARNDTTIAVYANNGGDTFSVDVRRTFSLNLRYQFMLLYTLDEDLLSAAAEDVNEAIAAGTLRVGEQAGLPLHHYPLTETSAVYDAVEQGAVGKVLIDISRPV